MKEAPNPWLWKAPIHQSEFKGISKFNLDTTTTLTLEKTDEEKIKIDAKRIDVGKRRSQFEIQRRFGHREFVVTFVPELRGLIWVTGWGGGGGGKGERRGSWGAICYQYQVFVTWLNTTNATRRHMLNGRKTRPLSHPWLTKCVHRAILRWRLEEPLPPLPHKRGQSLWGWIRFSLAFSTPREVRPGSNLSKSLPTVETANSRSRTKARSNHRTTQTSDLSDNDRHRCMGRDMGLE